MNFVINKTYSSTLSFVTEMLSPFGFKLTDLYPQTVEGGLYSNVNLKILKLILN